MLVPRTPPARGEPTIHHLLLAVVVVSGIHGEAQGLVARFLYTREESFNPFHVALDIELKYLWISVRGCNFFQIWLRYRADKIHRPKRLSRFGNGHTILR